VDDLAVAAPVIDDGMRRAEERKGLSLIVESP
jgi:hypothetical protein